MALVHSRLGLEIQILGKQIRPNFFAFDRFTLQILANKSGVCKPTFYTFYTSLLRWNSTIYHTDLGQNAVFHSSSSQNRVYGQIQLAAKFTSGVLSHFQNAPWKAGFLVLEGQKLRSPPRNSKTISQRSEPTWLLKYLITPNFCAKSQPNRLATTFGPWNTFSDNYT